MKILWLTPGQLSAALLFGIMIAICNISIPHMVDEVKPQVITPVSTPPPVVITQSPAISPVLTDNVTDGAKEIILAYNQILLSPFYLIFTLFIIVTMMLSSSSRFILPVIIVAIGIAWMMGWIGWVGFVTMVGVCFMSMFIPSLFRMGSDNI